MRYSVAILITFIVCKCSTSELTEKEAELVQDVTETPQVDENCIPKHVINLITKARESSITATWEQPDNDECFNDYVVELVGTSKNATTNTLTYTFDNLQPCLTYEVRVTTRSINGTLGESVSNITSTSEPTRLGPVKNLTTKATQSSIIVTWMVPENAACVEDYSVELVGIDEHTTSSLTCMFDNLKPCSEYEIKVVARSISGTAGEYSSNNSSTSEPTEIGPVERFTVHDDNPHITWDHPVDAENCNITYTLQLYDSTSNKTYETNTTTETSYIISYNSWIGCKHYNISVTPTLGTSKGPLTTETIKFSKVANPPTCKAKEVNETLAVFECNLDDYEINMCPIQKIFINCEAPPKNNNGSWVIWIANATQDIEDDFSRLPVNVIVANISEFTNYTCYGVTVNIAGNSSESEQVAFGTKEGVPTAPFLYEITQPSNTTFNVAWEKPEKIPGVQQNYSLIITPYEIPYFIPDDKACTPRGKNIYTYEFFPSNTSYYFTEVFPSYKYNVSIVASTRVGYGPRNETNKQANPTIPDEPRSIDYSVNNNSNITDYDANVTLTWLFPCYTNGEMGHFEVDIVGVPYADLDKNNDTKKDTVLVNEKIENLDYSYTIRDLLPAFNYSVYIRTVAEANLKSDQPPLIICSPESYPDAPVFKPVTDVKENAFTMEWDEPPQKNGYLLNYNLTIVTNGSLYWVPPDCFKNNNSYPYGISPNLRSFTFEKALPYHEYSAFIAASTSVGAGSTNKTLIRTLPSVPNSARDIVAIPITPTNSTTDEYNWQALVSFKYPCNTYGSFKQFNIILHGIRANYDPHNETRNATLVKDEYDFWFDLRAEYKYTLTVQVETETHNSSSEKKFTSPSGVPPTAVKDIQAPVPYEATQAQFTFACDLFNDQYGTILYYALILGESNYEEQSVYGFWNGTNDTWPSVGRTFKEGMQIRPYQATPVRWNPFNDTNCYNYTFVLGDNSSEFNKPLQEGIAYTIKVRGFTEFGFRDSPTIIFLMPVITNLALILGLTFGILGIALLLGFIFVLWRKRTQWQMKKESIKSIPLTPIPVSIKQFSQYYNELRNNSDQLKQEFAFLGNKSNELILPSYDGLLPENKKKNRYTNIIPYDETRVKLVDTNDNYAETDYVNASYIMGYSGTMEYIATQGPMEHTCMDFWKMVIQENSSLIVMVAQFVEQNKDKCYKYFPNNHENIELENGIAIRCCTELDFKTHIVRTLLIQKDLQQWTVTHLQFTEWPDFGCPTGTDVILEFCQLMREHAERNSDPIVIHCSAGVGRTGTLIALDIVLQAIAYKRDIDIFGTVLNLRRDRKSMVQTEKQYLYIHTCIKDAIENPPPIQCDISKEPVYENLEEIKRTQSENNIKESIF